PERTEGLTAVFSPHASSHQCQSFTMLASPRQLGLENTSPPAAGPGTQGAPTLRPSRRDRPQRTVATESPASPRTHSVTLEFRMRYEAYPRPVETEGRPQLTHVDPSGAARMVDVSAKSVTVRSALAAGTVHTTAGVISLLRRDALPKGDALAVARVAGIMGAKRTPDLIPLCHPIALHGVDLALDLGETSVGITATVRTADRTGVEMEALTAGATPGP